MISKFEKLFKRIYLDVIKYKDFHFYSEEEFENSPIKHLDVIHKKKLVNRAKVASFTAKWLLKESPINVWAKVCAPNQEETGLIYIINEACVATYIFKIVLEIDLNNTKISPHIEDILYHFKFRTFDQKSFIIMFNMLKKIDN